MKSASRKIAGWIWVVVALAALSSCEVTSEKIQRWKSTQKGPDKLRSAVSDDKLELGLRVEAAEALTDIGLVEPLADELRGLEEADRAKLGQRIVDVLQERLLAGQATEAGRGQLKAKDALFGLRGGLGPDQRARVDEMLLRWLAGDWGRRSLGEHSGDKVASAAPASLAGPILAEAVAGKPELVVILAEQLRQVGRPEDRERGAAKLIDLARRQKPVAELTLEALGKVGAAASRAFLLQLGSNERAPSEERAKALQSLSLDPNPAVIATVGELAADPKQPDAVRSAAFEVLEVIPAARAAEVLGQIVARDKKEVVRYRSAEALVRCCKAAGVAKLLESLPTEYSYAPADVADFLEADIKKLGEAVLPVLRQALSAPSWIARLVAVRVLADIGKSEDRARLEPLVADKTRLKGWDAAATIGAQAQAAAKRIGERK